MPHTVIVKPNRILAIVVGCIALVTIVAAVVGANRSEPTFDPATPEGTVQGYLQAVFAGDDETAVSYLASDTECDTDDLRRAMRNESARVVLRGVEIVGDEAEVEVDVTYTSQGGPFDAYEWTENQSFDLVREGERWALEGEPWPLYFCRRG